MKYFGEQLENCGHCGICLGDKPVQLNEHVPKGIHENDLTGFNLLARENPAVLSRPRQQARYLCGLESPAASSIRGLHGNPLFGVCSDLPFWDVLTFCSKHYETDISQSTNEPASKLPID